jgi:hypothetical protein
LSALARLSLKFYRPAGVLTPLASSFMPRLSRKAANAGAKIRIFTASDAAKEEPASCPLCGRTLVPGPSVDEHHLVPKSKRGRDKFLVHRVCHTKIHATLTEHQLATEYHTWEALRAQPEIAAFIAWVRKKPPQFVDRNYKTRALRGR